MSSKNQIYLLAGTSIVLAASTAYLAYKNYSMKESLKAWASANVNAAASLPKEVQDAIAKAA